jgi:hypothetical protein
LTDVCNRDLDKSPIAVCAKSKVNNAVVKTFIITVFPLKSSFIQLNDLSAKVLQFIRPKSYQISILSPVYLAAHYELNFSKPAHQCNTWKIFNYKKIFHLTIVMGP